jgi:hypothetical protein
VNHSLWELSLYYRHRHDELLAERQSCTSLSLLPTQSVLASCRRTLGLYLIAAGRALAGADALHEAKRPMHPMHPAV